MKMIDYFELPELKSNRNTDIVLRPINEKDTSDVVKWRNSDLVKSQFIFRDYLTEEMHRRWLIEKVYAGSVVQYIILCKGISIGSVYIRDIDYANESCEFGIFIGESSYLSKGIGTEVAKLFVEFCFTLGLHRVFLRVLATNERARHSYAKVGFCEEGIARDMVIIEGKRCDVVFMSIIDS